MLVFVQFPDLLQKVHEALTAAGLRVAMLKGTPTQRSKVIEDFQQLTLKKGDARVLLLNLRDESAAGANLTQASHAIFLHPLLVGSQQEFDSCDTQARCPPLTPPDRRTAAAAATHPPHTPPPRPPPPPPIHAPPPRPSDASAGTASSAPSKSTGSSSRAPSTRTS